MPESNAPARILIGKKFFQQIEENILGEDSLKMVYENFISPLKAGNKTAHLPGKYKPSWEINATSKVMMQVALVSQAQTHNLHHYHFGYPEYKAGRDPHYPGQESAGIVHTSIRYPDGIEDQHLVIQVDNSHPSPFRIPIPLELAEAGAIN